MGLSKPTIIIIAVYATCGALLVAVLLLGYHLYTLHRKRKLFQQKGSDVYGWYPGFTRITTPNLAADPGPGTYEAPCRVSLTALSTLQDEDILVHVRRTPNSSNAHAGGVLRSTEQQRHHGGSGELLGTDAYYHDAFLMYGSPLVFTEPGEYVVQAYTVHNDRHEVGSVHQFVFQVHLLAVEGGAEGSTEAERLAQLRRNRELSINLNHERSGSRSSSKRHRHRRHRHGSSVSSTSSTPAPAATAGLRALPPLPPIRAGTTATLAPRITPASGEVTDTTPIVITPNEHSRTADQIRYSTDGSYPTVLYTGSFTISVPPREISSAAGGVPNEQISSKSHHVVVKAIAVAGGNTGGVESDVTVSPITEAHLRVVRSEMSFYDPTIPAPSLQLRAVDAQLYFDTTRLPTFHGAKVFYQIYTVDLTKRNHVVFDPQMASTYDGVPVAISADVARIYAWTVVGAQHSRCAVYDAASGSLRLQRQNSGPDTMGAGGMSPYTINPALPPPLEVGFEDPPANSRIAYTLNHTEPALTDVYPPACAALSSKEHNKILGGREEDNGSTATLPPDTNGFHTFLYESGRKIRLSLLDASGMYITAPAPGPGGHHQLDRHHRETGAREEAEQGVGGDHRLVGYRFSAAFHRGFHYQDGQPMKSAIPFLISFNPHPLYDNTHTPPKKNNNNNNNNNNKKIGKNQTMKKKSNVLPPVDCCLFLIRLGRLRAVLGAPNSAGMGVCPTSPFSTSIHLSSSDFFRFFFSLCKSLSEGVSVHVNLFPLTVRRPSLLLRMTYPPRQQQQQQHKKRENKACCAEIRPPLVSRSSSARAFLSLLSSTNFFFYVLLPFPSCTHTVPYTSHGGAGYCRTQSTPPIHNNLCQMQIIVQTLTGKTLEFAVAPSDTPKVLKERIRDLEGYPPQEMRLCLEDVPVEEEKAFGDYRQETLTLMLWRRCALANIIVHRDPPERTICIAEEKQKRYLVPEKPTHRTEMRNQININNSGPNSYTPYNDHRTRTFTAPPRPTESKGEHQNNNNNNNKLKSLLKDTYYYYCCIYRVDRLGGTTVERSPYGERHIVCLFVFFDILHRYATGLCLTEYIDSPSFLPPTGSSSSSTKEKSAKDNKKAKGGSESRRGKKSVTVSSPPQPAPVNTSNIPPSMTYEATALLLTEKEVKSVGRDRGQPETLGGAVTLTPAAVVGFHGRLGEASWATIRKQVTRPPSPESSSGDAVVPTPPSTTAHNTLLVGLSRSKKQDAMLHRTAGCNESGTSSTGFVGVPSDFVTVAEYRQAVTQAVRAAMKTTDVSTLRLDLPSAAVTVASNADVFHPPHVLTPAEVAEKTACFAVTGAYRYSRKMKIEEEEKEEKKASKRTPRRSKRGGGHVSSSEGKGLQTVLIDTCLREDVQAGCIIGRAVNDARNLGNLRQDEGTPELYTEWALEQVRRRRSSGIQVKKVLKGEAIASAGLNLLYNVGKGSRNTPYVVVLEYIGNRRSTESTALVGKGVTFDCGGLNVKPYGSMETMHTDMMGAATVLSVLTAASDLHLPINLVAAVGLVENAIGPDSYHPGSIIQSLSGLQVEVRNTDAEGRLVMADLFTYLFPQSSGGGGGGASSKKIAANELKLSKKPTTLIDVATLTGSIVIALGSHRAGLFCNDPGLNTNIMEAGTWCGEEVWPMPVGIEHVQQVQGRIADLINTPPGREGGSCTAAAFLSHFVPPGLRWAHLDIAGPSDMGDKGRGVYPPGATGFGAVPSNNVSGRPELLYELESNWDLLGRIS
eukprot:gene9824-6897_t